MRARWPLLATVIGLAVVYVAYPYVTLYRLGTAIKGGNTATLVRLVDWPAVREGIKEDICDLGDNAPAQTGDQLPAFGASFMRGIASSSVDRDVTPQALLAASVTERTPSPRGADVHLRWAFFDSLTTFLVSLTAPGQAQPIKLEMDLRGGEWRVQRVWLPTDLLAPGSKT